MNQIKINNTDCLSGLKNVQDMSIDLVITSPPYENLREYNGYIFNYDYFKEVANELLRCLKVGAVIIWVVADKTSNGSESGESFRQALYFKEIGFKIWDTMIFAKYNPAPKNHRRYEQEFEYMFVFAKGKPKCFNPIMIPCKFSGQKRTGTYRQDKKGQLKKLNTTGKVKSMKVKGNIWYYVVGKHCTENLLAHKHQAIFPDKLAEDHIITWSNEGDLVLDPFMGSGTVGRVCKNMKRLFIGFEISKDYCESAQQMISAISLTN
ncbi:site-specific DNA-methyltransferase [Clostridium sp.]|uniref:DNA-methyltransferase n=1 Tax=Clostridium sp. TaxID=1506 RepID=UPI001A56C581|nr:site-specific DNA-methyltransferase [Clostridium sp.]MBK5240331.1 site-specific DNA-methyltransferase [Clostridium sp.]